MRVEWPIVVSNDGDVLFFRSLDGVQAYLEPIDTRNGEYVAYDSAGRLLELCIEEVEYRTWLGKRTREQVSIADAETDATHADELHQILGRYLSHCEPDAGSPEDMALQALLERAMPYGDVQR